MTSDERTEAVRIAAALVRLHADLIRDHEVVNRERVIDLAMRLKQLASGQCARCDVDLKCTSEWCKNYDRA